ncbi:MAG TPA: FAD-binding oxidoreductase [Candidatus Limnocylindrales bacterium]|nr:FAD-binding oxidoreductase [Candidatus Limnocylindrales bacterium]
MPELTAPLPPAAPAPVDAATLAPLRARVRGPVILPGDDAYDTDRRVAMWDVDARPAAIVRVADATDAAAVVAFARETGAELAVRCGGHSGAAHSASEGGLVLDVRDLRDLDIDVEGRTAWVGAGLTAGQVTEALGEHGLAVGFGDTGSVGVAGITLGGGIGYLVRAHGMTIDNLLAVELVTADGEVRLVDEAGDPELFWAVRGGGGNVGVATRFRFRLAHVPEVTGGMLLLPATPDSIVAFMAAAAAAPDGLSAIANVMPCPPMPFVPEERHGELVILALVCWSGDPTDADSALAPLRAAARPIADMLASMPYTGMYPEGDEPGPHLHAVNRNFFMGEVTAEAAALIVDRLTTSSWPMRVVQLRALGGAMGRVPADATAFAHRDRPVMGNVAAMFATADETPAAAAWSDGVAAALRDREGAYVNFLSDEGPGRVHEAYPAGTWERLAAVKRRVDPDNLFRRNQNVDPAGA